MDHDEIQITLAVDTAEIILKSKIKFLNKKKTINKTNTKN
jgi:hypothetical protein